MKIGDEIRYGIAMHPGVVVAMEQLAAALLIAASAAGESAFIAAEPLAAFAKPLIDVALAGIRSKILTNVDYTLNEFIQAQPTVKAGDGKAGLVSIEEVATKGG